MPLAPASEDIATVTVTAADICKMVLVAPPSRQLRNPRSGCV